MSHPPDLTAPRRFITLPLDTPDDAFGPLAGFVSVWRSKWRHGRLPAWTDFDFYDFVGWHGLIHVDEVVCRRPFDMRCRLWGTRLVELLNHDETGRLLSESPSAKESGLVAFHRKIVEQRLIGVNLGVGKSYGRWINFTVVKLPCAGGNGRVDITISCSRPDFLLDI